MEGGTLFISRKTAIFSLVKSVFEDCGFKSVIPIVLEKDDLDALLNELKPNYLFLVGLGEFKKTLQLVRIPNYLLFLEAGKLLHGGCYGSVFDD